MKNIPTTHGFLSSTLVTLFFFKFSALVKKAPYRAKLTKAALPIAKPLPTAAVVLPAASKASVLLLTPYPSSLISAIPPALSQTGPKASTASPIAKVDNIPRAAKAGPNTPNKDIDPTIVAASNNTGIIVDK